MPIKHTRDQEKALELLGSNSRHVLLRGGARSGKTVILLEALLTRALAAPGSRHLVARFRANSLNSIFGPSGSFFWVLDHGFPEEVRDRTKAKTQDGVYVLPNGSEVWHGGLDDPKRVDKLLGNEYCVDPLALVLTADLHWVRAFTLKVGQEIVGFPENLAGHTKLERATVQRSDIIEAEKFRIVTDRGSTVVSAGHGFVTRFDDRRRKSRSRYSWRKAEELSVGDSIRFAAAPWFEGTDREDGWFAGILDGEGWASALSGNVGVAQRRGPVLDMMKRWLEANGIAYREHVQAQVSDGEGGPCVNLIAKGMWAAMRMLGIARPYRLKAGPIWEGRRAFTAGGYDAEVLEIIPLGRGQVVALGTSSKTFIADGFLGHNSTVYVNEASQVPWGSFTTVLTRLAQVAEVKSTGQQLRQRCYIDCNPPPETHWLHRVFMLHQDPETRRVLANPGDYITMLMNPEGNAVNLDPAFIESLKNLPERQRKRFWLGQFGDAGEAALWTAELIDQQRILDASKLPQFTRIAVIIDPSGADDIEDTTADEIGIGVVALGTDGRAYVLEDLTMKGSPAEWGKVATDAYDRYGANAIVGEANFGGAMVRHVIQTAKPGVAYFEVTASRGKHLRAEPVSALWEQDKVRIVGRMADLEDEMTAMTTAGYTGTKSPNRLDWMVWGVTYLFPKIIAEAKAQERNGFARPVEPRVNVARAHLKGRGRR